MSYILDALRRAESERQRGQVPGLGSAALPLPAAESMAARPRHLVWVVCGLVAAALVFGVMQWRQPAPAPVVTAAPAQPVPTVVPAPVAAPAAVPPAVPLAPLVATLPIVVSAPPAAQEVAAPRAAAAAAPAPAPSAPDHTAVRLADLTPQQRSEWTPVVVGGSVWSDSAASRFVIIDGQVLREGQPVRPGLVLERIGPKAAWLRWRGLRVEVPL